MHAFKKVLGSDGCISSFCLPASPGIRKTIGPMSLMWFAFQALTRWKMSFGLTSRVATQISEQSWASMSFQTSGEPLQAAMSGRNLRNKKASHGYIRIQEQNRSSRCCKALPLSPTVKSSPDHDASIGKDGSKFTQGGMDLLHMVPAADATQHCYHRHIQHSPGSLYGSIVTNFRDGIGAALSQGKRQGEQGGPPPPRTSSRVFFGDPAGPGGEMWWRQR